MERDIVSLMVQEQTLDQPQKGVTVTVLRSILRSSLAGADVVRRFTLRKK